MKTFTLFVSLFLLTLTQVCLSQPVPIYNPISNVFAVSLGGGATLAQSDFHDARINLIGTGSLEYFLPSSSSSVFGLKIYGGVGYIGGATLPWATALRSQEYRSALDYVGVGATYILGMKDFFYPYISAGFSSNWCWPRDKDKYLLIAYEGDVPVGAVHANAFQFGAVNVEVGFKMMVASAVSVNLSGTYLGTLTDRMDAIHVNKYDAGYTLTAGLSYYFGKNSDADKDGVVDYLDQCPNTPLGVKVDVFGCALDNDNDGVADYMDKCKDTPPGVNVDANGCPVDADADGVADYLDKCPNTPKGVLVNSEGCALDSDGDGIADYLDKCGNTPAGVQVDENGCPLDADADGVADYLDKCPNTPKGIAVDEHGCPPVKAPVEKVILRGDANFETGKAVLLPGGMSLLDELAPSIKNNPNLRWVVEGYTDAVGSNAINLKLSDKRAQAVIDYLVAKGVSNNVLIKKAFGKKNPVADNKTPEGRAQNRRVEIKVIK
jgi:outer membrane protein OmpA-like peptidoglycan-associated protein